MKINHRKELQNNPINHSADIDYNDFVRIYGECTRKPYSFLTIEAKLPASDPLRFRKGDQAQYYLDRLTAKISAYTSDDLKKYEYLTSENLGYKLCT